MIFFLVKYFKYSIKYSISSKRKYFKFLIIDKNVKEKPKKIKNKTLYLSLIFFPYHR